MLVEESILETSIAGSGGGGGGAGRDVVSVMLCKDTASRADSMSWSFTSVSIRD